MQVQELPYVRLKAVKSLEQKNKWLNSLDGAPKTAQDLKTLNDFNNKIKELKKKYEIIDRQPIQPKNINLKKDLKKEKELVSKLATDLFNEIKKLKQQLKDLNHLKNSY